MRIFVVDDDPFALRLVSRQLESLGLTDVQTFDVVKTPLGVLADDPAAADVILLDLALPDMDGMECVQQLAKLRYQGTVIFISGMDAGILQAAPVLAKGLHLRVGGALKKPCALEELRAVLDGIAAH
jgi:CheY-like chemotaxis protein